MRNCHGAADSGAKRAEDRLPAPERALFLSFPRTAVAQIIDRAANVIGAFRSRLEVSTFDGFAWLSSAALELTTDTRPHSVLSKANSLVKGAPAGLTYDELIPAASDLSALSKVRDDYSGRYGIVICDEFEDTDTEEWEFLQLIAPSAQRILLGDANQWIYTFKKGVDANARIDTPQLCPAPSRSHCREPAIVTQVACFQQRPRPPGAAIQRPGHPRRSRLRSTVRYPYTTRDRAQPGCGHRPRSAS